MIKNKIAYILFLAITVIFSGCEKDEDKVVMSDNPVSPTLVTVPSLALERNNATDTLTFVGTLLDPGFVASATYTLEACASGNGFKNAVTIYTDVQDTSMKITVSNLNTILLDILTADSTSSVDLRITSEMVTDAGTGANEDIQLEYTSDNYTGSATVFGLPRLDLIDSGEDQKIESANGDGVYNGMVKLDASMAFTLLDPDNETYYGGSSNALSVDGSGITVDESGWYDMDADLNELTYSLEANFVAVIGSAVDPDDVDWATDVDMDYDSESDTWYITRDMYEGEFKFRLNDGWTWNLGGTYDELEHNGDNLVIDSEGNYTITLTITSYEDETGSCTVVKND